MKKLILFIFILVLIAGALAAWLVSGPATDFKETSRFFYIKSDSTNKAFVLKTLKQNKFLKHPEVFSWLAGKMKYWNSIKPGKYEIKKGDNILSIIRMLRNGRQTQVNLIITKIRTKEDLARIVGNKFECDSLQMINFLNNHDSLSKYGLNTETSMTVVLPNTYTYFWNTTPRKIFQKLVDESQKFWTEERRQQATNLGLTETQAYILASIIEEETNATSDKPNIASVYLNRIEKKMPLQADPTVKFALKDFGLKRIYQKHLAIQSPYNTYLNTGLPPGPICTPSAETLEAVLNAPKTDYLYFVANSDFSGTHIFTTNYTDHQKYAKEFQKAQDKQDSIRNANQAIK
ncbi:MAG: endolytic transglycosylase MltG [Bacteroidota bacterium]|nr:endolytic transglycosylase MltG [Bacteroidota bacterium]